MERTITFDIPHVSIGKSSVLVIVIPETFREIVFVKDSGFLESFLEFVQGFVFALKHFVDDRVERICRSSVDFYKTRNEFRKFRFDLRCVTFSTVFAKTLPTFHLEFWF